ncbi:integrin beta-like protein A [Ylistrum balloti]|uniref:integrin beta-like protein A n=1 Tax=Ylistrum balloti TaxID=509963 RepID=UPI002905B091|nr:integrin beta-like protein A [Ylistrum balloti]
MVGKQDRRHFFLVCFNFLGLILNTVPVLCDHFRGGTISWRVTGANTPVNFRFRLAYGIGKGPGCNKGLIGKSVTQLPNDFWECSRGCPSVRNITDVNYVCSSIDLVEAWEQGQDNFKYTIPTTDPFTVAYTGRTWLNVSYGQSGDFHLQTTGDLRIRSDTGQPNSSPLTASMPIYQVPFGCKSAITIPIADPDDDVTVCRWAVGAECGTDCLGLPAGTLKQSPCRIELEPDVLSGFVENGWYKVLMMVEDLPKTDIFLDKNLTLRTSVLSTVPLQFVVHTIKFTSPSPCNIAPSIVPPTPLHGKTILVPSNDTLVLRLFAMSSKPYIRIKEFIVSTPYGVTLSPLNLDINRTDVWYSELSWKPHQSQFGENIFCFQAVDTNNMTSPQRCFTFVAEAVHPCDSGPCLNNGTCSLDLDTYKCSCPTGFTGRTCDTDIDECSSNPCLNGGTCWNRISEFVCFCPSGFIGRQCQDTDNCAINSCQNFGTCMSSPAGFNCTCLSGYMGNACQYEQDECSSLPCQNGGTCEDMVGGFLCRCPVKYTGTTCQTEIDYCHPNPCLNGGACTRHGSSYSCDCPGNYLGLNCERPQNKGCSSPEESYCMCNVDGKPVKVPVPVPEARTNGLDKEDLVAGLIGFPIGTAVGAIMAALWHYLIRPKCHDRGGYTRQPQKRPGSSLSTRSLIGRTSPVSPSDVGTSVIPPQPLNVYRAAFKDPTSHRTGVRLSDDSYLDGVRDWPT